MKHKWLWLDALVSGIIFGCIFGLIAWFFTGGSIFWGGIVFIVFVVGRLLIEAIKGPEKSAEAAERMVQWSADTIKEQAEAAAKAQKAMQRVETVQELGKQVGNLQKERNQLFKDVLKLEEKKDKLASELASKDKTSEEGKAGAARIEQEISELAKHIEQLKDLIAQKGKEINFLLERMHTQSLLT